jgi:Ca2+-binding EF-hand superfamily protein
MSPQRQYTPRRALSPLRYEISSSLPYNTTIQQPNVSITMNNNNNINASLNVQTPLNTYIPHEQPNNNLFLSYINNIITYETQIENAKIELSMHNEFNVEDAFRMFELNSRGYITDIDLKYGLSLLDIYTTPNDVKLLMRRLDLKHKGHLTYSDFFDLVTPYEKDYRTMIEHRITNNGIFRCSRGNDVFGIRTTICLQNLLRLVINVENDFERKRIEMSSNIKGMLSDVFRKIDKNGVGSVSDKDMNEYLQYNGMFCSDRENGLVFIRFDRDRDGKVELWELNEEFKV